MKTFLIALLGAGIVFQTLPGTTVNDTSHSAAAWADTTKKDPETGLIVDENLYMVKAQCTNCHSTKLISANRFTRDGWKQKIRWMQANHNLWELGDAEKPVLDYLEKNYSPTASVARRAPLKDIKWYKLEQN
ncbi:hypothetical protein GCM10010967_34000 [Dyadobacter beijingensis]|uniref:Uncharacterized protein n=1 Tax=Dyadobacter beijingensis TaxID=365489 RepID=A0ABQ2I145_9BACT|nr:hypothetical protein [Dyadobacter beijingensis]GGM97405.1 hypothetical protein GCM10010967_34000 [Dyadobacter beijingensis]